LVNYNLTEAQLKEGCKKCIENVQNLLDSAQLLLNNENNHQYALGLYMYAIEEYGKAEKLRAYLIGNKITYSIPGWIFGHRNGLIVDEILMTRNS
jgi:HEPN superfamily AbiV-like protein